MEITVYKCDVCGKTKGDTNHWWWAVVAKDNRSFYRGMYFAPWERIGEMPPSYNVDYDAVVHICGQSCVMAKVSEIMGASK